MSTATKELTDHGKFLRNAAPREFENFYEAFAKYTDSTVMTVINTSGDDLRRVQGHAQQCIKILQVLEDIKNG